MSVDKSEQLLAVARQEISLGHYREGVSGLQRLAIHLPEAAILFAVCLRYGIGVETPQPCRALSIARVYAISGYVPAMIEAGLWLRDTYYLTGVRDDSVVHDEKESNRLLSRALEIDPKNVVALCARGLSLLHGRGCDADIEGGLTLLGQAADGGSAEAKCWLAKHIFGRVTQSSASDGNSSSASSDELEFDDLIANCKELLESSAKGKFGFSHIGLAELYKHPVTSRILFPKGSNRQARKSKIHNYCLQAAANGVAQGHLYLAEGYSTGIGSEGANFDKAVWHYKKAFSMGLVASANAMGWHCEKGGDGHFPDRIDVNAAIEWYALGREGRHGAATLHLGEAHDDGVGRPEDPYMAEQLYVEARKYAETDDEPTVVKEAADNLRRLYLGQSLLATGSAAEQKWHLKLEGAIGKDKSKHLLARVRGLLAKLSHQSRASRGGKLSISSSDLKNDVVLKLERLVGQGCAAKLCKLT